MPLIIAIPYFLIEALAFWGVSQLIGVGWALVALFLTFFGGLVLAAFEMKRIGRVALHQQKVNPGRLAGDYGLLAAGAILVALPGFVTTVLGLLFILSPTRALVRGMLAKKLRVKVENLGMKGFEQANRYREQASYGSFMDPNKPVIDEEEIHDWSENVKPEDFK
ncbi:phage T7 F exclusion suppressor FxsA [Corynebacterium kalinowskii]|uniref:Phage T7 F exclusion suppressor FxsA n=1 Tax=Corynebacterium kalinowskii TaxID=2675216 RepID=A0A6B8VXE5_9CORY|nr:FxsA family protein [Corynebacterium kalinowskii]QGU01970.1 phage T7 F exclusion suppressor FxsA [Corynebacterium kalinowskii]